MVLVELISRPETNDQARIPVPDILVRLVQCLVTTYEWHI